MRRLFIALLCGVLWAAAHSASDACAQVPAATITVAADFTFTYQLDAEGWMCRFADSYAPMQLTPRPFTPTELARCAGGLPPFAFDCDTERALMGAPITCASPQGQVRAPTLTVQMAPNARLSSQADIAGRRARIVVPRAVANELGAPSCGDGCHAAWEAAGIAVHLVVEPEQGTGGQRTESSRVERTLTFGQRRLSLSLRRCQLRLRSTLGAIVLAADRQRIAIEGDCTALDGLAAGTQLALVARASDGQVTGIPATVEWGGAGRGQTARETHIALSNVPTTLPAAPEWTVAAGDEVLGQLNVAVVDAVSTTQLEARYTYPELEVLGGGVVAPPPGGSGPGVAVVDPTDLGRLSLEIDDGSAEFTLPPSVCDRSTGAGVRCPPGTQRGGRRADPLVGVANIATLSLPSGRGRGIDDGLIWCASSPDGDVDVLTPDLVPLPRGRWAPVPNGLVRFRVRNDRAGRIELFVRAVRSDDERWLCGADLSCWERQYRAAIVTAEGAIRATEAEISALPASAIPGHREHLQRRLGQQTDELAALQVLREWLNAVPTTIDVDARDRAFDEAAAAYRNCLRTHRNPIQCDAQSDRAFAAASERTAELERASRVAALWRAALGIAACNGTADVDLRVRVATSARRESVPLPVSNRLSVVCEYDEMAAPQASILQRARDGEIIAPVGVDACRVEYHPELSRSGSSRLHRLRLYGRQMLRVRVRAADQQEPIGEDIVFEPFGEERTISGPLRFPVSGQQQDDFIVTAVIGVRRPDVPYRRDTVETQSDGAEFERGAYRFIARVRPRGALGQFMMPAPWRGPSDNEWIELRFFLTVPVGALAVRLPASPIDLESSHSEPNVHASTLRTGILLVAEPWNFRLRRNPTLIGLQAQAGLLLQSPINGDITQAPSLVYGVGFSLPLVQQPGASQFGVSASLSLLAEHDLRNMGQAHFLMLVSANVLTLLSPQQGGTTVAGGQ